MLDIFYTNQFKKDYKKISKSGNRNIADLQAIIGKLVNQAPLEERHRDHNLTGNWNGSRECHVAPDWLLIYQVNIEDNKLILVRTGSHTQLFR